MKKFLLVLMVHITFIILINIIFTNLSYADEICPSCSMSMFWTGETKTEWGKILKLYKCPAGHAYWIPMQSAQSPNTYAPSCPICGMSVYWTGETRVEWGKMQKIYQCPAGHRSVGGF
jgi:hypothetical protein